MKNNHRSTSTVTFISAFLMGVVLLLGFGRGWLNLESRLVFLAGLVGVALPVLLFGMWNILRNSRRDN